MHEVAPGMLYRSGQLFASELRRLVEDKGIRTVLKLRGSHEGTSWDDAECDVAQGFGIRCISIGISAGAIPTMATMTEIRDVMRNVPSPILVHCEGGADRSGLASAIFELTVAGKHPDQAGEQLTLRYLHFPYLESRTAAMDMASALFASS